MNTIFKSHLENLFSNIQKTMDDLNSSNDIVFIFDKNSLIKDFAEKALKMEFENILTKNKYIKEILIINENQQIILKSGNNLYIPSINKKFLYYFKNNCYLILKSRIDFKAEKNLIFILNLNDIFYDFLSNLKFENAYKLLISQDKNFYLLQNHSTKIISSNYQNKCCFKSITFSINNNINLSILEDKHIVFKNIYKSLIFFILILLFIPLFTWPIARYISSKISNPLIYITKIIGNFNFKKFQPVKIKKDFDDEIKLLATKFNFMGSELTKYINNMEKLVAERTKKIEEQKKELEQLNKRLKNISITDALTSLYNRRFFNESFISDYKFAYREKLYINFAIIDIDHFKKINDNYGHLAGDYCLKEFGKILKKHFHRDNDKIFRYGGEEFVIYYLSKSSTPFKTMLESIRKDIEKNEFKFEDKFIKFTISIGAISKIPETNDYKNFLEIADNNLYQAKNLGRNKIIISY
ncbi:diguanylate cyclase [Marinitoga aeolica]|uniref:Diguanylate cyclase n=1 Tax=Marinitoga aeolica TaxID=2809031 RepID=A0ABY8PN14_9BACT|nr:diguanylate cyclase [Marinitoga aeolica]WGS64021.1 diguanylate cyclase [Marinitoga aeolica]